MSSSDGSPPPRSDAPVGAPRTAAPRRRSRKGLFLSYAMIALPFLMLFVFAIYPFIQGLAKAFFNYNGGDIDIFIGVDNFVRILTDTQFHQSLLNALILTAFAVLVSTVIPLWVAWMVHHFTSERLKYLFRILVMLPTIVPMAVSLLIWSRLLSVDGVLNTVLGAVGLGDLAHNWLGDQSVVLLGIMLVGLPWLGGVNCLLYLGAFGNVPPELYEAAELDGGKRWTVFRMVEYPFVAMQTKIIVMLGIIGGLQAYENIYILTKGGPNDASMVPGLILFRNAFSYGQYGYASAIGATILILTLIILGAFQLVGALRRRRG
ncbi:carbohydrate ABC transporter permease [Microbacterium sp. ZW T5_45]|uniref:carbohydrate ABC transporter permease n=1 Tax=Microbacterium sp. ZW T5_45 TaxID=3378080 RepID=UPI003852A037